MPNIGGWAGIAAKLAGAGTGAGAPGFGAPGAPPSGQLTMPGFHWPGIAPKPDVTPTSPYYPKTAPEWTQFAPDYPDGYWSSEELGYGYKQSDQLNQFDVFLLSDPNTMVGTISEAELWSGRGAQTTPWGQEQAAPTPPEPILSAEGFGPRLREQFGLLPDPNTITTEGQVVGNQVVNWVEGTLADGRVVRYVAETAIPEGGFMPQPTGQAEVYFGQELVGTVPADALVSLAGEQSNILATYTGQITGGGRGGPDIPSKTKERREEDLLALPGAGWEGIAAKIEDITPEMATMMLMDPRWGAEERAAALPIKEAYRGWQENVLSGDLSPAEAIESFTGLFGLEGEPSVAEQTRLMQDIVQYGLLTDVGVEQGRQIYETEYRAQLGKKDVEEEEARSKAAEVRDAYQEAASFMEDFVPTGFSWDALQEVMGQSPELRASLLSLFQEKGELPHGVVRRFPSMGDYYRWQTSVAEGQPTTEAEVIWSSRDTAYEKRAEQILGHTPREGEVITPSDARAIVRSAMWAGGAEAERYQEALEAAAKEEKPSDYRRIYEEFVEELPLYRPAELWREGR